MERFFYFISGIMACMTAIALFALGYSVFKHCASRNKLIRHFWLSTAIALALLTAFSCGKAEEPNIEKRIAKLSSQLLQANTPRKPLDTDAIEPEITGLLAQIQKQNNLSDTFTLVIKSILLGQISQQNISYQISQTCYRTVVDERFLTYSDLVMQYSLLTKMKNEHTITPEIFGKAKESIINNLEKLCPADPATKRPLWEKLSAEEKDIMLDLVIKLNTGGLD